MTTLRLTYDDMARGPERLSPAVVETYARSNILRVNHPLIKRADEDDPQRAEIIAKWIKAHGK